MQLRTVEAVKLHQQMALVGQVIYFRIKIPETKPESIRCQGHSEKYKQFALYLEIRKQAGVAPKKQQYRR